MLPCTDNDLDFIKLLSVESMPLTTVSCRYGVSQDNKRAFAVLTYKGAQYTSVSDAKDILELRLLSTHLASDHLCQQNFSNGL